MLYIYLECTEEEATLRSDRKPNQNATRGMLINARLSAINIVAIRLLLENRQP